MSYQVLARKWRPQSFKEMVGQEHVLKALINALDENRLHHAYLFTGTRGVGKTTVARNFAKALNCEEGISSTPCGKCKACVEISEGRFIDLIEVDAASRTKVEDTRELLDNVLYAPTNGRFKIYLIDEVHMLSSHSFNALLKTLEEPPPHVKFLLATTDPQKLPVTILSRCLQFNMKPMPPALIAQHLEYVLEQENISFEKPALQEIAFAADGSMRDALSLTDQAIAYGNANIQTREVREMLGTVSRDQVLNIVRHLVAGEAEAMMQTVAQLAQMSPDFDNALSEIISLFQQIAMQQTVPGALDTQVLDYDAIVELAGKSSAEDIQLFYQIALIGRRDLALSPDMRGGFEMVLLRMLAFKPVAGESIAPQTAPSAARAAPVSMTPISTTPAVGASATATPAASASSQPRRSPLSSADVPAMGAVPKSEAATLAQPAISSAPAAPVAAPVSASIEPQEQHHNVASSPAQLATAQQIPVVEPEPVVASVEPVSAPAAVPLSSINQEWHEIVKALPVKGMARQLALNCELKGYEDKFIVLNVSQEHKSMLTPSVEEQLASALSGFFKRDLKLKIETGQVQQMTPAVAEQKRVEDRFQQAQQSIEQDTVVQQLKENFGATLIDQSVRPLND